MEASLKALLDERELRMTISIFGIDVIITPEQDVKFIEFNGSRLGYKGLEELTGRTITKEIIFHLHDNYGLPIYLHTRSFFKKSEAIDNLIEMGSVHFFDNIFEKNNSSTNKIISYLPRTSLRHFALPAYPHCEENCLGIIWNSNDMWEVIDETQYLVMNPHATLPLTTKNTCYHLFKGYGQFRPETIVVTENNQDRDVEEFLLESSVDTIVLKPADESCGKDVFILQRKDITDFSGRKLLIHPADWYREVRRNAGMLFDEPTVVMEEFIRSKPLYSTQTGEHHAGCMRYVVLVESENGNIKITHFGGYWRLAPESLQSSHEQRKNIANYCNGAIAVQPSDEDLELVAKTVNEVVPVLYKRLLRFPMNEKPDRGMTIEDYCY